MNTETRRPTGRPSKGPRRTIGVRVPVALADRIERMKELTGVSMGEIVLAVIERHADEIDPDALEAGAAQPRIQIDDKTA